MRRSDSWPTCAIAGRSASSASASAIGWKLPLLSIRPDSTSTSGLSSIALSSIATARSRISMNSRNAPWTCGPTRNESGSWTDAGAPGANRPLPSRNAADVGARGELAGHRLGGEDGGVEDRWVARQDLERGGEHEVGDARQASGVLGDDRGLPDRHAVRRDQRQAVLGLEDDGLEAGPRQRLAARQDLALDLGMARPDQHLGDRGHVHEVRRAHRAGPRDDGRHARR